MEEWTAVILAGGSGSRMGRGETKVVRPICGIPMVRLVSDIVLRAGIDKTVVVVPPDHTAIQTVMSDDRTSFAIQASRLGTGDALVSAMKSLDRSHKSHVLVLNADVPLIEPNTIVKLIEEHTTNSAVLSLVTAIGQVSRNLGTISRDETGQIAAVIEGDRLSSVSTHREINVGVYCFRLDWLRENISKMRASQSGEFYITELVEIARQSQDVVSSLQLDDLSQALGVNTLAELAEADDQLRSRIRDEWIDRGVYIMDRHSVQIDWEVSIGEGTRILPNTVLLGQTTIGTDCEIGFGTLLQDAVVGNNCKILSSVIEGASIEDSVSIGPFSHLRPGTIVESEVHIGNYAEVKASRIGKGSKMGHFSYMGDAEVGSNVNIGAGTITCNFDGDQKHSTVVGNDVFLGSDTMLVAPISIGDRARTGAGAVVTKDVPDDTLVAGVPARVVPKQS